MAFIFLHSFVTLAVSSVVFIFLDEMFKCSFYENDVDKLLKHYVDFHNIERTDYLLKSLFEAVDKSIFKRKCNICDEMFHTEREIKSHNF